MKLDNIDGQALTAAGSLLKYRGLRNLGRLPSPILQDLVEEPRQLERLRTMCFWDSMVATFILRPYHGMTVPVLTEVGAQIEGIACDIIKSAPLMGYFSRRGVVFCLCSAFQLAGEEICVPMDQLIDSVQKIRIGNMRGRIAPTELLRNIVLGYPLLPVSECVYPVMRPVEYESGKFGLLGITFEKQGVVIRPKYDYQAAIPGHRKVAFILENTGR